MIIGISGRSQSGKDTVGKIIQYLVYCKDNRMAFSSYNLLTELHHNWQIKKFADPLKDIVCILTGCTREQLEDIDFKNSKLPDEWIKYGYANGHIKSYIEGKEATSMNHKQCSKEVYEYEKGVNWQTAYKHHATYREILQYIGTELFRNILHEDTWINALFSEYKLVSVQFGLIDLGASYTQLKKMSKPIVTEVPNWIITDVRFPNEYKAVKDRGGIMIRVNRFHSNQELFNQHPSETALDNYEFDYIIDNNSDIDNLINNVKIILQKEKLI